MNRFFRRRAEGVYDMEDWRSAPGSQRVRRGGDGCLSRPKIAQRRAHDVGMNVGRYRSYAKKNSIPR